MAEQLDDAERDAEQGRGPQAHAQRAAHHARIARTEGLCRERRNRRDESHAEHEGREQNGVRQRRGRNDMIAEPAEQGQIGRHHGDLPELRQRDRQCQPDRLGQFDAPVRRCGRGGNPGSQGRVHCHRFGCCRTAAAIDGLNATANKSPSPAVRL